MATNAFTLSEVLAVARTHPFYAAQVRYPLNPRAIQKILESVTLETSAPELRYLPLTTKKDLYKVIERLTEDANPENPYRQSSYLSITGGGSGGIPMLFATDTVENRMQRARMGTLLRTCGLVGPRDWVLTTHVAGSFYRSLDLTSELLENAGASVLSAGNHMDLDEVTRALAHFQVNVLSGDGSQVVRVVNRISTLSAEERQRIKLDKIIYTSEPLTHAQKVYITTILGQVKICSILGSSEAGPWALGDPLLTGDQKVSGANDFVFDTRTMLIEILDPSTLDEKNVKDGKSVADGTPGIIVQTSLQRLRNPLVRYVSGDIGSLHPLPGAAGIVIDRAEMKHLRLLRLYGRDDRFSFKWFGSYFEFDNIVAFMQTEEWGILQWQVVLGSLDSSPQSTLEVRIFRSSADESLVPEPLLIGAMETFFFVQSENRDLFQVKFLQDLTSFDRSSTGGKILKFVDKLH